LAGIHFAQYVVQNREATVTTDNTWLQYLPQFLVNLATLP